MTMTDPIADFLTRLRNAALARHWTIEVPASKLKAAIASLLVKEGFLTSVEPKSDGQALVIKLTQQTDGQPMLRQIRRVSKPGLRVYVDRHHLPRVMNDYGIAILSTSQGLMTNREARKRKLGGEIICEVS